MTCIRLKNDNCGFGTTTIEFTGCNMLGHCATYLAERSGNVRWDKPYLGEYALAEDYLKANLKEHATITIDLCMGGGSCPDYEHIEVSAI